MQARAHVVWDWNGTLFDDFDITVRAASAACVEIGAGPVDHDTYRRSFTRPVRSFYERLIGRGLVDDEWHALAEVYHAHYRRLLPNARLRGEAVDVLARLADAGVTQSLLSMSEHDELLEIVGAHGIGETFLVVEGAHPETRAASKHEALRRHVAGLEQYRGMPVRAEDVVLIGDTLDDSEAAASVGAACVLLADGSYDPAHASERGLAVEADLVAAAESGLRLVAAPE
ncbi:phosphoglycolate phosphatase-like HAD superfamily hydrolase [Haloactinopolyspora alba]|uniref:Phosphoglycolate phosphatase-like HAD superfamily hydrolase n=1 Tax=Haloactinopolyspora alba TaxID=648780 RepID=A0A2P8E5G5_9ACTN|nr:HAD hydrolase-like protein [Haloactinopolyspora alba]PSL04719.1 phosphoglycolate phosphatase-like HAD superfamily hydrolase [Haloactinopolyspora alba]